MIFDSTAALSPLVKSSVEHLPACLHASVFGKRPDFISTFLFHKRDLLAPYDSPPPFIGDE